MPYKRLGDANKAILGIRPRVTLAQANDIAAMADAIADEDSAGVAWPIAISQWKKSHVVRSGAWVMRESLKQSKGVQMAKLSEVTKTVAGKSVPAGSFLVVADPEAPSTWSLQVKDESGKPDHRLMGAAWAALHGGYRGNKYEGPDKGKALAALKALYKSEDMETPVEEAETITLPPMDTMTVATTFADLQAMKNEEEAAETANELVYQFQALASNIINAPIEGKAAKLRALSDEFVLLVAEALGEMPETPEPEMPELPAPMPMEAHEAGARMKAEMLERLASARQVLDEIHSWGSYAGEQREAEPPAPQTEVDIFDAINNVMRNAIHSKPTTQQTDVVSDDTKQAEAQPAEAEQIEVLAESIEGSSITLLAEDTVPDGGRRAPVKLDVVLIRPGWGNKRDGHYYPADMLRRDAHVFEGAKMYATDHRQADKSVRTEVSRVDSIKGFTDDGAPIASVTVFEPDFAEMVRNRADAGLLNTLECSILAGGKAKDGMIEGSKGKIVEAITSAQSVDWVTRAGAGGQALQIAEAEPQPEQPEQPEQQAEQPEPAQETQPAQPAEAAQPEAPAAPVVLSEAEVDTALSATRLPSWAIDWLKESQYKGGDELQEAIRKATERVKKVTRAGQPFADGGQQATPRKATLEEMESERKARFNQVMRQIGAKEV